MEKTRLYISELLAFKSAVLFDKIKRINNLYSGNYVFVTLLKEGVTPQDVKKELILNDCTFKLKLAENSHLIETDDEDGNVVVFYANDEDEFEWLTDYHSYFNSIILGRIFKSAGFKLSEDGLQYQHRHSKENHQVVIGEINVTKNYKRLLEVIGLDYDEYRAIKTEEDLFNFIIKSPNFKVSKFISDEKEFRVDILIDFERFLILNKIQKDYTPLTFEKVTTHFPEIDFETKIAEFVELDKRKKGVNEKFNGRVILDSIPGYDKKKLNHSMGVFKSSFGNKQAYEDFVINNTQEQIIEKFKEQELIS